MEPRTRTTSVDIDDRRLAATVIGAEGTSSSAPGVLFVHGRGSSQRGYLPRALSMSGRIGAICLTLDLSGQGRHDAGFSAATHLAEVRAAFGKLSDHPDVDAGRIGVCGASYGAYLAAWLTASSPVRKLLLRAPVLYDDYYLDGEPSRSSADAHASSLFDGLNRSPADILVVESECDEEVPHAVIEAYLAACPKAQHKVLRGARHGLEKPEWDQRFVAIATDWFIDL